MRIVYDARIIHEPSSGLGRFTGELLLALLGSGIRADVQVHALVSPAADGKNQFVAALDRFVQLGRCVIHRVATPPISVQQQWAIPRFVNQLGGDLFFYPHFDVPAGVRIPFVFVVHDVIPLKLPEYVRHWRTLKQQYYKFCVRRGLQRARRCIAVSATTKKDMLSEFGEQWEPHIHVSYEGTCLTHSPAAASLRQQLGVFDPYLLYVGTRRPNKNIGFMLDMFREMRRGGYRGELVMAGSTTDFGFDFDGHTAGACGLRILGGVTDEQLAALYADTDALVFMSKYEGFGIPVIEAARFGRRMILSDGGSLREIAPPSACVISLSTSVVDAARVAGEYLRTTSRDIDLTAYNAQFSWRAVARKIFSEAY